MEPQERMYQVQWGIGVLAISEREAAEKARAIQLDPDTEAVVFYVRRVGEKTVTVDLSIPS